MTPSEISAVNPKVHLANSESTIFYLRPTSHLQRSALRKPEREFLNLDLFMQNLRIKGPILLEARIAKSLEEVPKLQLITILGIHKSIDLNPKKAAIFYCLTDNITKPGLAVKYQLSETDRKLYRIFFSQLCQSINPTFEPTPLIKAFRNTSHFSFHKPKTSLRSPPQLLPYELEYCDKILSISLPQYFTDRTNPALIAFEKELEELGALIFNAYIIEIKDVTAETAFDCADYHRDYIYAKNSIARILKAIYIKERFQLNRIQIFSKYWACILPSDLNLSRTCLEREFPVAATSIV